MLTNVSTLVQVLLYAPGPQRTSEGGNGNHSVSLPIISIKISRSYASIFIYKLVVGLFLMILLLISYFLECTALFLG